ncbi:unnamed protein product [Rhizoctonia solani]|uniref:Uncharacterized protein n=1 Tax=Rhizoctonia solani TaxID=456999 RepID=A0A8H3GU85_9AGAM|nr:unnamed protein product [Rhizoctonia solani]
MTLLPGENSTYTPPTLPWHITSTLKQVVGAPSNEDVKAVHNALRSVESLASHPQLFDEDLSMTLSQHMFNLQFARYMHDSTQGGFISDREPKPHSESVPQATQPPEGDLNNIRSLTPVPEAPSELAQLGEVVKGIKGTLDESKNVLENMNRVLISTQRTQPTTGYFKDHTNSTMHLNPVNQQGVLASEHGLPQLRYYCTYGKSYSIWMHSQEIAGYLKFFGIGANLVQSGEVARLKDGKEAEAEELLQKHVGLHYI